MTDARSRRGFAFVPTCAPHPCLLACSPVKGIKSRQEECVKTEYKQSKKNKMECQLAVFLCMKNTQMKVPEVILLRALRSVASSPWSLSSLYQIWRSTRGSCALLIRRHRVLAFDEWESVLAQVVRRVHGWGRAVLDGDMESLLQEELIGRIVLFVYISLILLSRYEMLP